MFRFAQRGLLQGLLLSLTVALTGCASMGLRWGNNGCSSDDCQSCKAGKSHKHKSCDDGNDGCDSCGKSKKFGRCSGCCKLGMCSGGMCSSCCAHRSLAIPDEFPVGAVMRAHMHQQQTNGEAMDFVLFQKDFVLDTAELTPDGKDKILEIAARMRSAPFPVLVERGWNNSDPELDAHRRALVAQILTDLGNNDANYRTIVSPAYGDGKRALEGAPEFYQYTYQGVLGNNNNGGGFGGGGGGGFGGGGGGFGGGGGGFGGGFGL